MRHHSPACSYALKQLIKEVQPTHILIEAPSSFDTILEQLLHIGVKPPVAVLCQTQKNIAEPTKSQYTTDQQTTSSEPKTEDNTSDLTPKSITYSAFLSILSLLTGVVSNANGKKTTGQYTIY